jgi:hypothetical protein
MGLKKEDPDINPWIYTNWSSTKEPKTYDGEKTVFSTNVTGKTRYPHVKDWN